MQSSFASSLIEPTVSNIEIVCTHEAKGHNSGPHQRMHHDTGTVHGLHAYRCVSSCSLTVVASVPHASDTSGSCLPTFLRAPPPPMPPFGRRDMMIQCEGRRGNKKSELTPDEHIHQRGNWERVVSIKDESCMRVGLHALHRSTSSEAAAVRVDSRRSPSTTHRDMTHDHRAYPIVRASPRHSCAGRIGSAAQCRVAVPCCGARAESFDRS
jgi:hypothetical protein